MRHISIYCLVVIVSLTLIGTVSANTIDDISWGNVTPIKITEGVGHLNVSEKNNPVIRQMVGNYIKRDRDIVASLQEGTMAQLVISLDNKTQEFTNLSFGNYTFQNVIAYRIMANDADTKIQSVKIYLFILYNQENDKVVGYGLSYESVTTKGYLSNDTGGGGGDSNAAASSNGGGTGGGSSSGGSTGPDPLI